MTISAVISPVIKRSLLNSVIGGWNGFISDVLGAMFSFINNEFSTTVPGGQSRTFLETHVYTGGPKLTLKGDGSLGWNRHNLVLWSGDPSNSAWSTGAGITSTVASAFTSATGDTFYTITATAGAGNHYRGAASITVLASTEYVVTARIRAGSTGWVQIGDAGDAAWNYVNIDTTNWLIGNKVAGSTATLTAIGNGEYLVIFRFTRANAGNLQAYYAPIQNNGLTTPSFTAAGTETAVATSFHVMRGGNVADTTYLRTFATVPALDEPTVFNTSGTRLGIVLEPAATNNAQYSQAFSTGGYVGSNYTIGAAVATSPDGTVTGGRFTESAATTARFCYSSAFNGTGGVVYTESIYVKAGVGRTAFFLNIQQSATNYITAVFDLSASAETGTATETSVGSTSGTLTATKYEKLPNGWYRLSITGSTAGANSFCFGSAPATTGNAFTTLGLISFAGSTSNYFDAWGFQIETGTVATSYIPTTTASVTRTADTCYRVLGPEYASGQGSLAVDFYRSFSIAGNTSGVGFDDGSDNNVIGLGMATTNALAWVRTGGVTQANAQQTFSTSTINRFAMSWQTNSIKGAVNNVGLTEDTSATIPTVTTLRIAGMGVGGTFALQPQTISRVRYSNTAWAQALVDSVSNGGEGTGVTLDFNYATGSYAYTPVNAGVTTSYTLSTLISSGLMTLTGSPSAKWVRGSNGLLQQVTAGELAIEYDASGNVLGCINTEPARTNIDTRSNDLVAAGALATRASIAQSSAFQDPFGGTTVSVLTEDSTSASTHELFVSNLTQSAGTTTHWCIAKANGRSVFRIVLTNAGFGLTNVSEFTLSGSGTASLISGSGSCTIEALGNGWYYCAAVTTSFASSGAVTYRLCESAGVPSYDGNGTSGILIGHRQTELGSYRSSAIPTTSAAVTRAADVWTLNLGSWFDNSRWIVASKVYAPRANMAAASGVDTILVTLEPASGTAAYMITSFSGSTRIDFAERAYSVTGAAGNNTGLTFPATIRSAIGFAPSNAKASLNGATQTLTGTPSPIQASLTRAGLGVFLEGSNPDQGSVYIQSLNILPVVPTQSNVNQYASGA